ncbi:MAG: hypothetical protein L0323_00025 [Planctomycetes bacterium]|nr:hypothetical protein [Planctomycetota bacterium]
MKIGAREDLTAAAQAFFEAAPWTHLADADLFGVRDEETGTTACASVLGAAGAEYGFSLCFGPQAFSILERVQGKGPHSDELLYEADVLTLCAQRPGEKAVPAEMRLGTFGPARLWAFRKPRGERMRAPAEAEARLLARVLLALAREVAKGRLPVPRPPGGSREIPFLVLSGKGSRAKAAWARAEPPRARPAPSARLFVPHALRKAIAARPLVSPWIVSLISAPVSVGEAQVRMFVVFEPREGRILHAEPLLGPQAVEEAGRALLTALAGTGSMGPYPGRPIEISTDSASLAENVGGALALLGIRVRHRAWVAEVEEVRRSLDAFLEKGTTPGDARLPGPGSAGGRS